MLYEQPKTTHHPPHPTGHETPAIGGSICKAGFETDIHNLQLIHIVANLMGIPTHQIPDRWTEIYINCLGQTTLYPITPLAENLLPLAEECYLLLSNLNKPS